MSYGTRSIESINYGKDSAKKISDLRARETEVWNTIAKRRSLRKGAYSNIAVARLALIDELIAQTHPENNPEIAVLTNERNILEEATKPENNRTALRQWFKLQQTKNTTFLNYWENALQQLDMPPQNKDYCSEHAQRYSHRLQTCNRFLKNF